MRPLSFFAVAVFSVVVGAKCFHPNGTQTTESYRNRCSDDPDSPVYNICCAIDRPNPSGGKIVGTNYTADTCLSNGICQNDFVNEYTPNGGTTYWREECTEADWQKGKCANFCLDDIGSGNVEMTPCDGTPNSETWCCGQSRECCGKAGEVKVLATLGASATPSASSTSSLSTSSEATTTPTTTPTAISPTASPIPSSSTSLQPSSGLSGGAKGGIAIGAVAGVAAIFLAGFFLAGRRKQQKIDNPYGGVAEVGEYDAGFQHSEGYAVPVTHETTKYHFDAAPPQELPSEGPVQELPVTRK